MQAARARDLEAGQTPAEQSEHDRDLRPRESGVDGAAVGKNDRAVRLCPRPGNGRSIAHAPLRKTDWESSGLGRELTSQDDPHDSFSTRAVRRAL